MTARKKKRVRPGRARTRRQRKPLYSVREIVAALEHFENTLAYLFNRERELGTLQAAHQIATNELADLRGKISQIRTAGQMLYAVASAETLDADSLKHALTVAEPHFSKETNR